MHSKAGLQAAALQSIQAGDTLPTSAAKESKLDDLRKRLRAAIQHVGIKDCEFKTGLHVAINDFLNGRTRPHWKTVEKLENT